MRKPTGLTLNTKGEAYAIHDVFSLEDEGGKVYNPSSHVANHLNMGQVQVNDTRTRKIVITNNGKFPFDFSWKLLKNALLSVTPGDGHLIDRSLNATDLGTVTRGESVECCIEFKPKRIIVVEDFKLSCKITNGNTYNFNVSAKAFKPALEFSFLQCDFGPCFLQTAAAPPMVSSSSSFPLHLIDLDVIKIDRNEPSDENNRRGYCALQTKKLLKSLSTVSSRRNLTWRYTSLPPS